MAEKLKYNPLARLGFDIVGAGGLDNIKLDQVKPIIAVEQLPTEEKEIKDDCLYQVTETTADITMTKIFRYNGKVIKDGQEVDNWVSLSRIILTEQQYNNLSTQQKEDGTIYVIEDAVNTNPDFQNIMICTQEEYARICELYEEEPQRIQKDNNIYVVEEQTVSDGRLNNIIVCTQAEYNAIEEHDSKTLYIVKNIGIFLGNNCLANSTDGGYTKTEMDAKLSEALNGLSEALGGKAEEAHSHAMSEVNGLSEALNGLSEALGGKAEEAHSHAMSEVNGLSEALEGKQNRITDTNEMGNLADTDTLSDVDSETKTNKRWTLLKVWEYIISKLSTSLSSSSTDKQIPSAKAVYTAVNAKSTWTYVGMLGASTGSTITVKDDWTELLFVMRLSEGSNTYNVNNTVQKEAFTQGSPTNNTTFIGFSWNSSFYVAMRISLRNTGTSRNVKVDYVTQNGWNNNGVYVLKR